MSNWIKPLVIILVLSCVDGDFRNVSKIRDYVKSVKKVFQKEKPKADSYLHPEARLFIHVVRVWHIDKNKEKSFECAGTVIDDGTYDVAITAASCFRDDQSKILKLRRVEVFTIDLDTGNDEPHIPAKRVEIYQHLKKDSTKFMDIAKVILSTPQERRRTIEVCNKTNFFEEVNIVNKTVAIAGWACSNSLKAKGLKFVKKMPMDMQNIRMKITGNTKVCKKARNAKKSYFGLDGFCAVGTKYTPQVSWVKSRNTTASMQDDYKKICEYRGGPVFSIIDDEGDEECLVGVTNGVLPSMLKFGTVTKKDWYAGITFTSIENMDKEEAYQKVTEKLYVPPKNKKMIKMNYV